MRRVFSSVAIAVLFLVQIAIAAPVKFLLASRDGRNVIKFISKAPLETIEGKTGQIDGSVEVDLSDAATAAGRFEVDLATVNWYSALPRKIGHRWSAPLTSTSPRGSEALRLA